MSRSRTRSALRTPLVIAVLVLLCCAAFAGLAPRARAAETYRPPVPEDFSALSWTDGFDALHAKISHEYAFTEWKGVDWAALRARYRPAIVKAQRAGNEQAYYLTLRRYILALRDGHAGIKAGLPEAQTVMDAAQQQRAGGGFGLVATRLEDGRVVASWIQPGGPAAKAGMRLGARIVAWNGRPVDVALARTSTVLSPSQPTDGRVDRERLRFLVRAPIGTVKQVTFRNHGADARRTVRLRAADDDGVTLAMTDERSVLNHGWPEKAVEHEILPGNVGYLRIYFELDMPAEVPGDHTPTLQLFRDAIDAFVAADVAGLVVDVRGNSGGSDQMVADMLASFCAERTFYEYTDYYNAATGQFEIWHVDEATGEYTARDIGTWIEPAATRYAGPIVALVDNACISSGEGIALGVKNLPNGKAIGVNGTNGSFGMAGDVALLPGGFLVDWPYGSSLDENKVVQLDSRDGKGGVRPDVRVPMTRANMLRLAHGRDVVLQRGLRELAAMTGSAQ